MDHSTFQTSFSEMIPSFLYFSQCPLLRRDDENYPVYGTVRVGSQTCGSDCQWICIDTKIYAEFLAHEEFLYDNLFDDDAAEVKHLKCMLDGLSTSSSVETFQRLAATVLHRLFTMEGFEPDGKASLTDLAALTDKRAFLIQKLEDLRKFLSLYREETQNYPSAHRAYDAAYQKCHPAKLKAFQKTKPREPSLSTCLGALRVIFDCWVQDFDSVDLSATEEATPPISARPSEVSVPPPKRSSPKPKSGSFSVVVHRHVVSIKPNSTNSSLALHSLVSKVSPESATPPRSPSTRSTPARALSPLATATPLARSSNGILPTPSTSSSRPCSPDGLLPTPPHLPPPARSPHPRSRPFSPSPSYSAPTPPLHPQFLAQLLAPYLAYMFLPCAPLSAFPYAPPPSYDWRPPPPILV